MMVIIIGKMLTYTTTKQNIPSSSDVIFGAFVVIICYYSLKTLTMLTISKLYKKTSLLLATMLTAFYTMAQDSTSSSVNTSTSTATTETTWYAEPWVWIVGAVVLLIIILLATRGNSSTASAEKVTITKTVTRDSDV